MLTQTRGWLQCSAGLRPDDTGQLQQLLMAYVSARSTIADEPAATSDVTVDQPGYLPTSAPVSLSSLSSRHHASGSAARPLLSIRIRQSQGILSPSTLSEPHASSSTRQLLVAVAQLTEDVMGAASEKVNLNRFACDLVRSLILLCSASQIYDTDRQA